MWGNRSFTPSMAKNIDTGPYFLRANKRVWGISGVNFAPGYHFCPNDDDLLSYLRNKNTEQDLDLLNWLIAVIDVYKYNDLPGELLKKCLPTGEQALYFFCPITKKYPTGLRVKRSSVAGNWRITGQDRKLCGMITRTLVFYDKEHKKTNWIMHEYRLEENELSEMMQYTNDSVCSKVSYVLCKLYEKSEPGKVYEKCETEGKDSQPTRAGQKKTEERSYLDTIVVIPDSLIIKLAATGFLPMNISDVGKSLQGSAGNDKYTPGLLLSTDEVHYIPCKPFEKSKPNANNSKKSRTSPKEIKKNDVPGPFISKLSGFGCLATSTSRAGESLHCSADNNDYIDVLGNTNKANCSESDTLPNKSQTSDDMTSKNAEIRDIPHLSFLQDGTADSRVDHVTFKSYGKIKPNANNSQKTATPKEVEMEDSPEHFIHKLSGPECLPMSTSGAAEYLQSSVNNDDNTGVLANYRGIETWPNTYQTSQVMEPKDAEIRSNLDEGPSFLPDETAENGWLMRTNAWGAYSDDHVFGDLADFSCGPMVSAMYADISGWYDIAVVGEENEIHMEDLWT